MHVKAALLIAPVIAASLPLVASLHSVKNCEPAPVPAARSSATDGCGPATPTPPRVLPANILAPVPEPLCDIVSGRGPNPHTRALSQFAIYAAIVNRDGMETISGQLRKFRVTREQLREVIERSKLHSGLAPRQDRTSSDFETASGLRQ